MSNNESSIWDEPVPTGYRRNDRGDLVRELNISGRDLDMDQVTLKIHGFAVDLSEQMGRFRDHTMTDIVQFADRVVEQYGGKIGGRHGNIQLTSFCGCYKVQLAQAQVVEVGPEIAAVQALVNECLDEWGKHSSVNLRALVDAAFRPGADGKLSVSALLKLKQVDIDDPTWRSAQCAIGDALRPRGRAEYIRIYRRSNPQQPWQQVPLDLARVTTPASSTDGSAPAVLYRRIGSAIQHARLCGLKEREIQRVIKLSRTGAPVEAVPEAEAAGDEQG